MYRSERLSGKWMLAYVSILQIWLCLGFHQFGTRDGWLYTTSWKTDSVCGEAHHSTKQSAEKAESACFPSHPIQRPGSIAVPMTFTITKHTTFFDGCLSVLLWCPLGAPAPTLSMMLTRLCRIWIRESEDVVEFLYTKKRPLHNFVQQSLHIFDRR